MIHSGMPRPSSYAIYFTVALVLFISTVVSRVGIMVHSSVTKRIECIGYTTDLPRCDR